VLHAQLLHPRTKAYKLRVPPLGRAIAARDVIFDEDQMFGVSQGNAPYILVPSPAPAPLEAVGVVGAGNAMGAVGV
jgi:hypothetical protein